MSAQSPDDLFYTKDHEWARIEDRDGTKVATIGVTRFAVEQLGFRVSDRTRMMRFLRCNRTHHAVAYVNSDISSRKSNSKSPGGAASRRKLSSWSPPSSRDCAAAISASRWGA